MKAALPHNETGRLRALRRYGILDTPPETAFDRLTGLAARLFDVPIVLVTLVDQDRQWFKSCYGLDLRQTDRDVSFCAHALLGDEVLVVPDATRDPRFADNPQVLGPPDIRFYAGAPLKTPDGFTLGTLCIIDTAPRDGLSAGQAATLVDLAALAMDELELRTDRSALDHLVTSSPVMIFRFDPDTLTATYVTPNVTEVTGYTPEEILGVPGFWIECLHPDDRADALATVARMVADRSTHTERINRFQCKDGGYRWLRTVTRLEYDEAGRAVSVLGYGEDVSERKRAEEALRRAHDELEARVRERTAELTAANAALQAEITERRRAEAALRASEEYFRTVYEAAPIGMANVDAAGRTIQANRALQQMTGYDEAELLALSAYDLTHPDDLAESSRLFDELVAGRRHQYGLEKRYRCKDGSWLWARLTASAVRDADGRFRHTISMVEDITARKRAEAALRANEARFRALVQKSSDAIAVIDAAGTVRYKSPAVERILGYTPAELEGSHVFAHLHPDDLPEARRQLGEVLATPGGNVSLEVRVRHRDGSWRQIEAVGTNLLHEPSVAGIVVNYRDITERKRAEEVQRAMDAAEAASRAKSEFLSRMSHELRTPLNAVLGFAQLLEADDLSADQRESVEQILKGGRHLLALVNEVLDISRIEAGRLILSIEPVHLGDVLQESLDLMMPLAAQRGIRLRSELAPDEGRYLLADQQRLKQVLLNLLNNAVKYNRPGGAVTVAGAEVNPGRLRLLVRDTGPGIAPEQLARLFSPFERLDAEGGGTEGTGLGLALSKRLVEVMGGEIGLESAPGRGSTFWVELPLSDGPGQGAAEASEPGVEAMFPHGAPDRPSTVLYIEDNLANLALIEHVLAHRPGVRLLAAMQGRLGLELAREHRPDLLLLDLHLPDLPGEEVLRRLREDPASAGIPVVVLSADATPGQVERLVAAGAQAYLAKPLDVQQFLAVLDEALRQGVH